MTGTIGHGTLFKLGNGAVSQVFTPLAGVVDMTPPNPSQDAVEDTDYDAEDGWRTYIGGLKDGGESSIELKFLPAGPGITALLAQLDGEKHDYRMTFPDNTDWNFTGILTNLEVGNPIGGLATATATFKLSGKPGFVE